jgi:hypothetical protein
MAFELKIYTSKSFLLKLEEFRIRSMDEFGSDIDIESYLFFKTIIYLKSAQIITDVSEDVLYNLKETPTDVITGHENESLIRYIKAIKNNTIKSDKGLILKLRNREKVSYDELPHYLFLDDIVGEEMCKDIERHYGISCFSTKRLKVPENIRKVCLHKLENTRESLYKKLNEMSYNSIHINDPFFFKNAFGKENRLEVIQNLLKRDKNYSAEFKAKLTTTLESRSEKELNEWSKMFEVDLQQAQRNVSFSVAHANRHDGTHHDRYVFTNRHINILGTSFFSNSQTHFTTFPIGIYGAYLAEELQIEN